MTPAPAPPHTRAELDQRARDTALPGWLRVALWAYAHHDQHGHAAAWPGQLRRELGFTHRRDVSRALQLARERGLIDPTSSAACVVLPGRALAPCESPHREATR